MATSVPTAPAAPASPPQEGDAGARASAPGQGKVPAATAQASGSGAALVPLLVVPVGEPGIPANSPAMGLRVELEVGVPVGEFRVRNLLALEEGVVVESRWKHSEDLPLAAGRVQLAWTEFEVVETQLAARLTRLA